MRTAYQPGRRGTWRTYDGTNGLPGPVVALLQDQKGYLWLGTWGAGASRYDGERFSTFTRSEGLAGDRVWALAEDGEGRLWLGTDQGLSCWDGRVFANYSAQVGLLPGHAPCFDREGRLWVGAKVAEFSRPTFISHGGQGRRPPVDALAAASRLIGTEGVWVVWGGVFTTYTMAQACPIRR
jgi:hypothetical protein